MFHRKIKICNPFFYVHLYLRFVGDSFKTVKQFAWGEVENRKCLCIDRIYIFQRNDKTQE